MEKYEVVRDIGSGNFGVAKLMRHKDTKELVAMKHIERGHRIDENVGREIINHRSLRHPNVIRFKEVWGFPRIEERAAPLPLLSSLFFLIGIGILSSGCFDADASGDRDGVRRGRRALRADLRRRKIQRRRGSLIYPSRSSSSQINSRISIDFLLQARYFFQQLICGVSYYHLRVQKLP
ncbi:hypothetical protein B296_00059123 [Ensete ventricosum]|uniref:non-specific serine/threonine protein kinase n=1 Tax=Ensete ventricosum TaxID=4639 RepID=A0A426X556_ENSVE|nr:hypothetical protein B296_00059123 [Ensete ventricosum]